MIRKFRLVLMLFALLLLYWWLTRRPAHEQAADSGLIEILVPPVKSIEEEIIQKPVLKSVAAISKPDDLKKIEGIGPKISTALHEAGIQQYSNLADLSADQIRSILNEHGIRIAQPETWPEQAAFAARGDWDGLQKFQAQLKGGRRTT